MNIRLTANADHKKQYKALLTSEWSLKTLTDSFLLVDDFLNSGGISLSYSERSDNFDWNAGMFPYMKLLLLQIDNDKFHKIPDKLPQRKSKSKIHRYRLISETIYDLTFPLSVKEESAYLKPEGDLAFLKDLKSLIFLLAANYILPELAKENMKEERDLFISVLFLNALLTWHDNPPHQNYLLSVLSDKLGWTDLYRFYLYNAFRLTLPDEHDYLTKAQAYWSALIDEGMFDEAEEFALRLLKNSGEKDFEEIKEIISLTFYLRKA